jgi:hypothetical protein
LDGFGVEQTRTSKIAETNVTINFKLDIVLIGDPFQNGCEYGYFSFKLPGSSYSKFVFPEDGFLYVCLN